MSDIVEFLLACIAEDEAAALEAHRQSMRGHAGPGFIRSIVEWKAQARNVRGIALIERMTPARVLAECDAKRRIVELDELNGGHGDAQANALRALASVYADRPGYDPAWAPETTS